MVMAKGEIHDPVIWVTRTISIAGMDGIALCFVISGAEKGSVNDSQS
jgi:hypothetical protein